MELKGRRVVVTGGAGFIGSHLVDRLIDDDNEVVVVDDFSTGHRENLAHHAGNPLLQVEELSVLDEPGLFDLFQDVDFIFHLACRNVRLSLRQPTLVHEVNATGTLNVLKAAAGARVRRLLYCSSSEVNGTATLCPLPEDYHFRPETIYGASKLAGEYYTDVFHRAGWLETVIARPHNNYGPRGHYLGDQGEVIPRFILWALASRPPIIFGDGNQTRDFTYVTETVNYLVRLMEAEDAAGQTFNVCRGQEISIKQIAEIVLELTGNNIKPKHLAGRPSDVLRLIGDPSRLLEFLGESPRISIADGLAKTIDWYKENVKITPELLDALEATNWKANDKEPWLSHRSQSQSQHESRASIPVARPLLGRQEATAAGQTILSGWVTQGPKVRKFEEAFAEYTGAPYACAVSNCTAALHLALQVVGVQPGDVVITVSHSFIATANSIRHCGAEPFFIDIDPATGNLHPDALIKSLAEDFEMVDGKLWAKDVARLTMSESLLGRTKPPIGRLSAILVVHQLGMPADLGRILPVAEKYGLPVVEDAACAAGSQIRLGSEREWESIGRPHGDVACFSFHPRKILSTGDGGMLTTGNPEYDRRFRLLRHHGMGTPDFARHTSSKVIFENYLLTGYNYRLTDIQAAVGIEQLKRLPDMVERRRRLVSVYREALEDIPEVMLMDEPDFVRSNWQSCVVRLSSGLRQQALMQALLEQGISTRRGVMCAHLESPYADGWPKGCLPESENNQDTTIILPLYNQMNASTCRKVVSVLREIITNAG